MFSDKNDSHIDNMKDKKGLKDRQEKIRYYLNKHITLSTFSVKNIQWYSCHPMIP